MVWISTPQFNKSSTTSKKLAPIKPNWTDSVNHVFASLFTTMEATTTLTSFECGLLIQPYWSIHSFLVWMATNQILRLIFRHTIYTRYDPNTHWFEPHRKCIFIYVLQYRHYCQNPINVVVVESPRISSICTHSTDTRNPNVFHSLNPHKFAPTTTTNHGRNNTFLLLFWDSKNHPKHHQFIF